MVGSQFLFLSLILDIVYASVVNCSGCNSLTELMLPLKYKKEGGRGRGSEVITREEDWVGVKVNYF